MIELNKKTQQDFLNREWVQKLLDAGVDMSDAKYCLYDDTRGSFISLYNKEWGPIFKQEHCVLPTYTVSELLYKLHEWIYPIINEKKYSGGIVLTKDAPFYPAYYRLKRDGSDRIIDEFIFAAAEYPIESLASVLIQCHKNDIGWERPDVGDISHK